MKVKGEGRCAGGSILKKAGGSEGIREIIPDVEEGQVDVPLLLSRDGEQPATGLDRNQGDLRRF